MSFICSNCSVCCPTVLCLIVISGTAPRVRVSFVPTWPTIHGWLWRKYNTIPPYRYEARVTNLVDHEHLIWYKSFPPCSNFFLSHLQLSVASMLNTKWVKKITFLVPWLCKYFGSYRLYFVRANHTPKIGANTENILMIETVTMQVQRHDQSIHLLAQNDWWRRSLVGNERVVPKALKQSQPFLTTISPSIPTRHSFTINMFH